MIMNDDMLGKIVTVKVNDRDNNGKILPNVFTTVKGKCNFIGINKHTLINQITLNRMPIFPFKEEDIVKIE